MAAKIMDAGDVLRTFTTMKAQDGATLRNIVRAKVLDGATLRTVATFVTPVELTATPGDQYATGFSSNQITSEPVTATPSGGLGPYTYSWAITGGAATITAPTSATTSFTSGLLTVNVPEYISARCTVTDATGQTDTADTYVTFYFYNPFGGY